MKKILTLLFLGLCFTTTACLADDDNQSEQAKLLYAENNIRPAFDILISIPEDKRTTENWLFLGNILHDTQKNDDALYMYSQALIVSSKNYKALYNMANIYLESDRLQDAVNEYKKAIKIKDDFAYAHYNLGCAYIRLGKLKDARNEFLKAVTINNQVPDFYYNLAYVYKKLNNPKLAKEYLEIYNKMNKDDADI